ncbi:hypothetical protein [Oribacterium sp. P9]|uniref:hypothetical protein n=1 Tax=Oribacterium sp. P9 TaxID=3378068 RepID=UPI002A78F1A3|nr:hypothetical protein [Oribacterium sp.]MDY2853745.1 hypothetical protein [Oliverpabstia sp.]
MSVKLEFPDEYMNILHSYAEQNNVTVETALADTLEFLELKNEEFDHYQVTIEDPRQYLNDADDMSAKAIRQAFMDLFGEDSVGDTIYCYYNPDKMDVLLMDIQYDDMVPLWTLLETFHNKIPGMELSGDLLSLFYVRDRFDDRHDEMAELMDWFLAEHEDDGFETAGYYESIFNDPEDEDEDFEDDEFDDADAEPLEDEDFDDAEDDFEDSETVEDSDEEDGKDSDD